MSTRQKTIRSALIDAGIPVDRADSIAADLDQQIPTGAVDPGEVFATWIGSRLSPSHRLEADTEETA